MKSLLQSSRRFVVFSLLILVVIGGSTGDVHGQLSGTPHFTMTVTGQSLTAGFNNTVTITLLNNHYGTVYDTDIAVSIPTTLNLVGDNHWHYDSIALGQAVNITLHVYAPTSAIGDIILGSLTATYRQLGDISSTQESHALGFSVYGFINLMVYGVQLTPSITTPGGNATISGNVLNSGNLAAYNSTVTVASEAIAPESSSSAFVGEIDPNIPRPFSLLVAFKPNMAPGNYSITVTVNAIDSSRPSVPIVRQGEGLIQIRRPTQQPFTPTQRTGIIEVIYQILRNLFDAFLGSLTGIVNPLNWSANVQSITISSRPI